LEGPVTLTFYAIGESGAPLRESLRVEWHANGWFAALEAHVASARNWERLLAYEDDKSTTLVQPHLAAPV
jgi:hypothetical protein